MRLLRFNLKQSPDDLVIIQLIEHLEAAGLPVIPWIKRATAIGAREMEKSGEMDMGHPDSTEKHTSKPVQQPAPSKPPGQTTRKKPPSDKSPMKKTVQKDSLQPVPAPTPVTPAKVVQPIPGPLQPPTPAGSTPAVEDALPPETLVEGQPLAGKQPLAVRRTAEEQTFDGEQNPQTSHDGSLADGSLADGSSTNDSPLTPGRAFDPSQVSISEESKRLLKERNIIGMFRGFDA
ncbi:hypothetical protein HF669_11775 [Acidithiobacillus thiooxidans]|uniref:hypothetical protein n=1 Tax=Acidithiobacillus TaxID=119977 RepID=UPI0002624BF8|nr:MULTISPECIES: hypothetical protein [Acidithiobacillus]MBU2742682.1 hypothetical protein [Acidithiobacillus albertensis]MBU2812024.1 hypothetical protein [Acidithiobacillus thiooxidans]MBU2836931.1 hypothetical protein [Acidithiobacillus thiooxidans]